MLPVDGDGGTDPPRRVAEPRLDPATREAFHHLRLLGVMSRRGTIRAQAE